MHGQGTFSWADGRKYQGTFRSGMMDGYGLYEWNDGRRYEGSYC